MHADDILKMPAHKRGLTSIRRSKLVMGDAIILDLGKNGEKLPGIQYSKSNWEYNIEQVPESHDTGVSWRGVGSNLEFPIKGLVVIFVLRSSPYTRT